MTDELHDRLLQLRRDATVYMVQAARDKRAANELLMRSSAHMRRSDELTCEANEIARRLAGLPDLQQPRRKAW